MILPFKPQKIEEMNWDEPRWTDDLFKRLLVKAALLWLSKSTALSGEIEHSRNGGPQVVVVTSKFIRRSNPISKIFNIRYSPNETKALDRSMFVPMKQDCHIVGWLNYRSSVTYLYIILYLVSHYCATYFEQFVGCFWFGYTSIFTLFHGEETGFPRRWLFHFPMGKPPFEESIVVFFGWGRLTSCGFSQPRANVP